MVGKGIYSGDLMIISRAETANTGDVIVANLNGTFVCKEVDKENIERAFVFTDAV